MKKSRTIRFLKHLHYSLGINDLEFCRWVGILPAFAGVAQRHLNRKSKDERPNYARALESNPDETNVCSFRSGATPAGAYLCGRLQPGGACQGQPDRIVQSDLRSDKS